MVVVTAMTWCLEDITMETVLMSETPQYAASFNISSHHHEFGSQTSARPSLPQCATCSAFLGELTITAHHQQRCSDQPASVHWPFRLSGLTGPLGVSDNNSNAQKQHAMSKNQYDGVSAVYVDVDAAGRCSRATHHHHPVISAVTGDPSRWWGSCRSVRSKAVQN